MAPNASDRYGCLVVIAYLRQCFIFNQLLDLSIGLSIGEGKEFLGGFFEDLYLVLFNIVPLIFGKTIDKKVRSPGLNRMIVRYPSDLPLLVLLSFTYVLNGSPCRVVGTYTITRIPLAI